MATIASLLIIIDEPKGFLLELSSVLVEGPPQQCQQMDRSCNLKEWKSEKCSACLNFQLLYYILSTRPFVFHKLFADVGQTIVKVKFQQFLLPTGWLPILLCLHLAFCRLTILFYYTRQYPQRFRDVIFYNVLVLCILKKQTKIGLLWMSSHFWRSCCWNAGSELANPGKALVLSR